MGVSRSRAEKKAFQKQHAAKKAREGKAAKKALVAEDNSLRSDAEATEARDRKKAKKLPAFYGKYGRDVDK